VQFKYDYSLLIGTILRKFKTYEAFAKELGITYQTLYHKLNNRFPFTQTEIEKSCVSLGIDRSNMMQYFFVLEVA